MTSARLTEGGEAFRDAQNELAQPLHWLGLWLRVHLRESILNHDVSKYADVFEQDLPSDCDVVAIHNYDLLGSVWLHRIKRAVQRAK